MAIVVGSTLALGWGAAALANTSPNGAGQPGAPNTTCSTFTVTPGGSVAARGAVFNPSGTSGMVYAGNPGTASLAMRIASTQSHGMTSRASSRRPFIRH